MRVNCPCQDIRGSSIRPEAFLTAALNRHDSSCFVVCGYFSFFFLCPTSPSLGLALLSANLNGQANRPLARLPSCFGWMCNHGISSFSPSLSLSFSRPRSLRDANPRVGGHTGRGRLSARNTKHRQVQRPHARARTHTLSLTHTRARRAETQQCSLGSHSCTRSLRVTHRRSVWIDTEPVLTVPVRFGSVRDRNSEDVLFLRGRVDTLPSVSGPAGLYLDLRVRLFFLDYISILHVERFCTKFEAHLCSRTCICSRKITDICR